MWIAKDFLILAWLATVLGGGGEGVCLVAVLGGGGGGGFGCFPFAVYYLGGLSGK